MRESGRSSPTPIPKGSRSLSKNLATAVNDYPALCISISGACSLSQRSSFHGYTDSEMKEKENRAWGSPEAFSLPFKPSPKMTKKGSNPQPLPLNTEHSTLLCHPQASRLVHFQKSSLGILPRFLLLRRQVFFSGSGSKGMVSWGMVLFQPCRLFTLTCEI